MATRLRWHNETGRLRCCLADAGTCASDDRDALLLIGHRQL